MLVGVYKTVQLRHRAHVRQPDERADIPERFVWRQGRREDARMRRDAQIRYQRRPRQAQYFRAGGARLDKAPGAEVTVARSVRRVEEHVNVEGIAHGRSESRAA